MLRKILRRVKRLLRPLKPNTVENNFEEWSSWDWTRRGEEWSNNPEWKRSLVEHVLKPNVPEGSRVLEIGPGGGRWTEHLLPRASRLVLVDLVPKCIEICRERFAGQGNVEYFVNDGRSLAMAGPGTIDRVWSWDVLVHMESSDIRRYVLQIAAILAPGGRAILHHSRRGRSDRGWRSDMTAKKMAEFCGECGLRVVAQFDSWDGGRFRIWPDIPAEEGPDVISVIERPDGPR